MTNEQFSSPSASFWHREVESIQFPKLEQELKSEIVVVGGGIAGILSAYEIAKSGKEVILVEARSFIHGTTGNTTAKLSAQHHLIYNQLIEKYEEKKARLYYDANMEGIQQIKKLTEEYQIECDLRRDDAFVYATEKSSVAAIEKEAKAYEALEIDGGLTNKLPVDLEIAAAVVMHNQYTFHPVDFLQGILSQLMKMDVKLYENTVVEKVEENEDVVITTMDGNKIHCEKAVCTTHYPIFDPEKYYTKHMEPEMSFATAYETETPFPGGMYISYDQPRRTFRNMLRDDKEYILVGGGSHTPGDGSSDLSRYEEIYHFATEHFNVEKVLTHWSSHDYMTEDCMPFIGFGGKETKNILVATGFSKWGLANAATGAVLINDLVNEQENRYQSLFNPFRFIPKLEKETNEDQINYPSSIQIEKENNLSNLQAMTYETEDDEKIGVFQDAEGQRHHLNLSCTHLGCSVGWNDGDKTWDCPCHGSRFAATGEVLAGPATHPLKKMK